MAQKGRALAAYAAMKGIRLDEAMAIGDSENDHSMLSMKLKYTLAMENAMDSTKRAASDVYKRQCLLCYTMTKVLKGVLRGLKVMTARKMQSE